jgi:hypothetical protein
MPDSMSGGLMSMSYDVSESEQRTLVECSRSEHFVAADVCLAVFIFNRKLSFPEETFGVLVRLHKDRRLW